MVSLATSLLLMFLFLQVKVWNLDKRDSGNPLCTRIFPAIPANKPTEVSCLGVHENLNFMAIGEIYRKGASLPSS